MRENSSDESRTAGAAAQKPKLRGTPARIIWGAADAFQKVSYGERLGADLGTSVERIDGGKHFTPEDHPEVIARGINELVAAG